MLQWSHSRRVLYILQTGLEPFSALRPNPEWCRHCKIYIPLQMLCFSKDPCKCQKKTEIQLKYLVCLSLEYLLGLEIRDGGPKRVSCRKPSCFGEYTGKDEKYKTCRYHGEQKRSIHVLFFLKNHIWLICTNMESNWDQCHEHFLQLSLSAKGNCTQNCTAPALPMLLFMRPHDELDHATDLSLKWQATQKRGIFKPNQLPKHTV